MKVIMQPIEMMAHFNEHGFPRPVKFKARFEDIPSVIAIDKIILKSEEKAAGNPMIIFRCQSIINGFLKIYELKYELHTCEWFLYKI
ncbi:MAG TPA: hypothetical protein GX523_15015 [Desulfitobacterium dehalogenans]|uniref:Uncharacterized protein n=1 Tax=Desulfitobacterium dehalogenans TaxID=36854 RepID=A0A7C6Z5X8_9FIRM|nr:hypothetical protein [Desulfitobacterium dehalogenans]